MNQTAIMYQFVSSAVAKLVQVRIRNEVPRFEWRLRALPKMLIMLLAVVRNAVVAAEAESEEVRLRVEVTRFA